MVSLRVHIPAIPATAAAATVPALSSLQLSSVLLSALSPMLSFMLSFELLLELLLVLHCHYCCHCCCFRCCCCRVCAHPPSRWLPHARPPYNRICGIF